MTYFQTKYEIFPDRVSRGKHEPSGSHGFSLRLSRHFAFLYRYLPACGEKVIIWQSQWVITPKTRSQTLRGSWLCLANSWIILSNFGDFSQVLDRDSQNYIFKSIFAKPFRNCFEETYLHNLHFLSGFPPFHHSPPDFYISSFVVIISLPEPDMHRFWFSLLFRRYAQILMQCFAFVCSAALSRCQMKSLILKWNSGFWGNLSWDIKWRNWI